MAYQKLNLYLDLIRWDRPVGWLLALWPSLTALWIASYQTHRAWPTLHLLAVFVLGTFLMRSAGCCMNDVADKDFDRHVQRTAARPITSGKVSRQEALWLGAFLALLAFLLVLTTNPLVIGWSFVALGITVIYPFTKRLIAMPQAVLGAAFGCGIPMAFAAVQQSVPPLAWWLFVGNLAWVLAYDTQYAMVDRDDDLKIGIHTSAITLGRWDVLFIMWCYALYLCVWASIPAWLPDVISPVNMVLWGATTLLACGQVVWHFWLIHTRTREGCFKAFRINHWLGLTFFVGVVLVLMLSK